MSSELVMLKKRAGNDLEEINITEDDIPGVALNEHLCWNCSNGYPSKCAKVADRLKCNIDAYEFIKSGYQIVKDESVERFIVTSCLNFEKTDNKPNLSGIEFYEEVGKLFTAYYGTETVREAVVENIKRKRMDGPIGVRILYY